MKRLTTFFAIASAVAVLTAIPLDAQSRGGNSGGSSRSGSGSGNSGSRTTSSMSSSRPSSSRSTSQPTTKGLSSTNRSSQPASSSASMTNTQPSRSSSATRSSASRNNSSATTGRTPSSGSASSTRQPSSSASRSNSSVSNQTTQPSRPSNSSAQPIGNKPSNGSAGTRPGNDRGTISRTGSNANGGTAVRGNQGNVSHNAPSNFHGGEPPKQVHMNPGPGRDVHRVPPMRREPIAYKHASRFWDRGNHYYGYRVTYLPARYVCRTFWGIDYYYYNDVYYRYVNGYYYVCRPPYGIYVNSVLNDIHYTLCNFAYYNNVYNSYRTINDNARTITQQNQIIAQNNATIAAQNETIALNGTRAQQSYQVANDLGLVQSYADASTEYYYDDGIFFVKGVDGKYVTIVPPAGALVNELPDDYEEVSINGHDYYAVDDTIYRASVVDGSLYFEVLGQMTGDVASRLIRKN